MAKRKSKAEQLGSETAIEATEAELASVPKMTPDQIMETVPGLQTGQDVLNSQSATSRPDVSGNPHAQSQPHPPSRFSWARRYAPPEVQYEVITKPNAARKPTIFIKFHGVKEGDKPPEDILEIMRSHKQTPEGYPTGLRFENDRIEGKTWQLPNTPEGRDTLFSIEKALEGKAAQITKERGAKIG